MARTIQYYYPDESNPASLKVFQDQSTQIRAIRFTRDRIAEARELEKASNYAIYFLFSQEREDSKPTIYIGQSKQGVERITAHNQNKDFWSHCILFVSDNNVFDMNAIDYMEYYFIHKLIKSRAYELENRDKRDREPNISTFNQPAYLSYIEQIEFLLRADGIILDAPTKSKQQKYYQLSGNPSCRVYFQDGMFVLEAGAQITPCTSESKKQSTINHIIRQKRELDQFENEGKLEKLADGSYLSILPISFKSPSAVACFLRGRSSNGWDLFEGINELRNEINES